MLTELLHRAFGSKITLTPANKSILYARIDTAGLLPELHAECPCEQFDLVFFKTPYGYAFNGTLKKSDKPYNDQHDQVFAQMGKTDIKVLEYKLEQTSDSVIIKDGKLYI